MKGFVRYAVITKDHPTLSCLLNLTSGSNFEVSWMLVARWVDLCPYGDSKCTKVESQYIIFVMPILIPILLHNTQSNNFQVVVVTNGIQSYAAFTYQCGELSWSGGSRAASIGFSTSYTQFANHPLSQQANINNIACINQQCPPWSNVVYQISKEPEGIEIHNSGVLCSELIE